MTDFGRVEGASFETQRRGDLRSFGNEWPGLRSRVDSAPESLVG